MSDQNQGDGTSNLDAGIDQENLEATEHSLESGPTGPVKLSHPQGLWVLFITEMWERFSYYGMRALLVLYLIQSTADIEPNPGFGWTNDSAYQLYGLYTWAVYLTPIFGGLIADKFLGTHRSMLVGGWIIALGHITLACTEFFGISAGEAVTMQTGPGALVAFMTGLFLIIIGTGFFKPCVSVMVGQLYEENDPRRDSGFTIFYMGINLGAFMAPLIAGTLGEKIGWHWGFGSAAVGMIAGLFFYQMFRPKFLSGIGLPPKQQAEWDAAHGKPVRGMVDGKPEKIFPLNTVEWQRIGVILILAFVGNIAFWTAFEQAGTSMNVFAAQDTDRTVGGWLIGDDLQVELRIQNDTPDDATFAFTYDGQQSADVTLGETTANQLGTVMKGLASFGSIETEVETNNDGGADSPIAPGDIISLNFKDAFRTFYPDATPADLIRTELDPPFTLSGAIRGADVSATILVDVIENDGIPATWYQSLNPLAIILFAPVFALIWVALDRKKLNPSTPMKFAWGLWLLGLAFIAMVMGGMQTKGGGLAGPHWLLITYIVYTWGELCLSPVGLSMITKLAPFRLQSFMMGMWFFSFSLSNLIAAQVARLSERLASGEWTFIIEGMAGFYLALVIMPICVGVFIMLISPILRRMMHGIH